MTSEFCSNVAENVKYVQDKIALAAQKSGRTAQDITLVGVTKTQPVAAVRALLQAGVTTIGENRVQELLEKMPGLQDIHHETHLIGHLQRNKAKFLPSAIAMLQSLDSEDTVLALEKAYGGKNQQLDVLIEVNIGDETSKTGVAPTGVQALAGRVAQSSVLRLCGLMAIPPICEGDRVRGYFEQMYQLFIDIKAEKMDNDTISILSMGMSSDYEYAILEGATMVRIGTQLFGPRK